MAVVSVIRLSNRSSRRTSLQYAEKWLQSEQQLQAAEQLSTALWWEKATHGVARDMCNRLEHVDSSRAGLVGSTTTAWTCRMALLEVGVQRLPGIWAVPYDRGFPAG